MDQFEQYSTFGIVCLLLAIVLVRMVVREHVTLQATLSFLFMLLLVGGFALFPNVTSRLAKFMGFTLPANFFFSAVIAALVFLHLAALVLLSRVQLRSIALTQELALLQEKVERMTRAQGSG